MILCIAHWCACLWYFIANSSGTPWIVNYGIEDSNWKVKYMASLYFSIATMTTVGYGDIKAVTMEE